MKPVVLVNTPSGPAIMFADALEELRRIEVAVTKLRHLCADGAAVDRLVAAIDACATKGASRLALLEWTYDRLSDGRDPARIEGQLNPIPVRR